jgi:hypothetical protein
VALSAIIETKSTKKHNGVKTAWFLILRDIREEA